MKLTKNEIESILGDNKPQLKYFKKLHVFKGDNVTFNPDTFEAHSYKWWSFVKLVGGKLVFNDYRYSPTTGKHQSKVKSLLSQLGIAIDFVVESPKGLNDLASALSHYDSLIKTLKAEIDNPRSKAAKNSERQETIVFYQVKMLEVKHLMQLQK